MPLVNFHNHLQTSHSNKLIAIKCLDIEESFNPELNGLYTIGLHPWKTNIIDVKTKIELIKAFFENESIIGLGEVGLDKLRGASIEIQKKILIKQVELAYDYNKPIIIHCVKAWDELLEVKKGFSNKIPWAVHGFNGSEQQTKQLIDAGFYLSVGVSIKNCNSKIATAIKQIPLNRLFLETDDTNTDIEDIYKTVSQNISIPLNELEDQLYCNLREFFSLSLKL